MLLNSCDSTITQIENKYIQNGKQKENALETYLEERRRDGGWKVGRGCRKWRCREIAEATVAEATTTWWQRERTNGCAGYREREERNRVVADNVVVHAIKLILLIYNNFNIVQKVVNKI